MLQLFGVTYIDYHIQLIMEAPSRGFLHRVLFHEMQVMDSRQILKIGRDISSALQYLHMIGFIHCAVAPFSIILHKTLQAKVFIIFIISVDIDLFIPECMKMYHIFNIT